jgi:predicted short-subunit dehydrogenase-like oxidoreductase (DUF2520 family)
MRRVHIVGPGRAGRSLARALEESGWPTPVLFARNDDSSKIGDGAEIVIIATPDATISEVSALLAVRSDVAVVHLAGSLGLDVVRRHPRHGAVHPLVALPDEATGARRLMGAWFAVAGDPVVQEIVETLGGRSFVVEDDDRARYHAAAVVASNHLVVLLGQAERIAVSAGVPFEALLHLARGTIDNVDELGPVAALTGPAARGDEATIRRHLGAIDDGERPLYEALAAGARRLAGRDGGPGRPAPDEREEASGGDHRDN